MKSNKILYKRSLFIGIFLIFSLTLPLPLYADPPATCPCFSFVDVMRYSHPPAVYCDVDQTIWYSAVRSIVNESWDNWYVATWVTDSQGPDPNNVCGAYVYDKDAGEIIIDIISEDLNPDEAEACFNILDKLCPRPNPS